MSSPTERTSPTPAEMSRRRGSVTQATLSTLFQRSSSVSAQGGASALPSQVSDSRRRLSLTTGAGVGLSGTSPTSGFLRRGSLSTNASEPIDENAVEEDDFPRGTFQRRMSYSAGTTWPQRGVPPSPGTYDSGFNWSEQLRSRAESLTMANRPNWGGASTSPPRGVAPAAHERAKSMAEMPAPPAQASSMRPPPPREAPRKPDAFQERILKGDFYMD